MHLSIIRLNDARQKADFDLKTRKVLQQDLFGLATGRLRQKMISVVEVDGSVKRHKASRKALDVVLLV